MRRWHSQSGIGRGAEAAVADYNFLNEFVSPAHIASSIAVAFETPLKDSFDKPSPIQPQAQRQIRFLGEFHASLQIRIDIPTALLAECSPGGKAYSPITVPNELHVHVVQFAIYQICRVFGYTFVIFVFCW